MTASTVTGIAGSRTAGWVSVVREAWRGLTPLHFLAGLALGTAVILWEVAIRAPAPSPFKGSLLILSWRFGLFHAAIVGLTVVLAVAIAERAVETGRAGRNAYALALVLAVGLAHTLLVATFPARTAQFVYSAMSWLLLGGLAVFVYVDRKRARAARERLAAAELERAQRAKQTLESQLAAMQARVEPQFLFNTLAQVRDLYDVNAALGERMLDELIAYLRAAMPKMRDTSSTVGQELELARAYLAILRLRLGERLIFATESPNEVADARMPPMMLLPLIDHAIAHGVERCDARSTIRVAAEAVGARIRLVIMDSGAGFVPENAGDGIASIRERLSALYGDRAKLVLQEHPTGATEVVLDIPYEAREVG